MRTFQQFINEDVNFKHGELIGVKIVNIDYIPLVIGSTGHNDSFDDEIRWNGYTIGKFLYKDSISIWHKGKDRKFSTIVIQPLEPVNITLFYPTLGDSEVSMTLQDFADDTDQIIGDVLLNLPIDFIEITRVEDLDTDTKVDAQGYLF